MQAAIRVTSLTRTYGKHRALDSVNLEILPGEMVALIGASGSGKSTLLRHVAGLAAGDEAAGEVVVHGQTMQRNGRIASDVRRLRTRVGFVFQQFNLVGRLPVYLNVAAGALHRIPLWRSILRRFSSAELGHVMEALARVGISDQAMQRASTLSGGQQQRAAIARTLVQRARVVLADEPIASLDPESARRVMDILAAINREDRCTVVVSLHQVNMAIKYCPRTVALRQGRVVYDGPSSELNSSLLRELYGAEADEILSPPDHLAHHGIPVQVPERVAYASLSAQAV
jgi:phosphonate transport system ATP-binding protein